MKTIDMTNMTINRLFVIGRAPAPAYQNSTCAFWKCRCVCGAECIVAGKSLRNGQTKSCGCLRTDRTRIRNGLAPLYPIATT